jgi:hypothetical protein
MVQKGRCDYFYRHWVILLLNLFPLGEDCFYWIIDFNWMYLSAIKEWNQKEN